MAGKVALVSTGGTIVSRVDASTGLAVPALSGDDLLQAIPGSEDLRGRIEVHDFARVGSPHITPQHWVRLHSLVQSLLRREDIDGVVVSHGTATLEETAWYLDLTLTGDKPVVFTGAQRNASTPDSDGPRNLRHAFMICAEPAARGKGVLVALNDRINAARDATKMHTVDVETFQSGEWGYLGAVVDGRVRFHRAPLRRLSIPFVASEPPLVEIVSMYAGATGTLVRAAAQSGARGIVVQAVGGGHVSASMRDAIVEVLGQGVAVVVATRIPRGGTRAGYGFDGSSQELGASGAVLAGDLSAWKARVVLMLALQQPAMPPGALQALYD